MGSRRGWRILSLPKYHQPHFLKRLFNNLRTIKFRNNLAVRVAGEHFDRLKIPATA